MEWCQVGSIAIARHAVSMKKGDKSVTILLLRKVLGARRQMNPRFKDLINSLHSKYESLISMEPVTANTAPGDTPEGGVYLFSDGEQHLYTGRTKRSIRNRLKDHVGGSDDCPFAWHLAREVTGNMVATYKPQGSRKNLLSQPRFKEAYENAKKQIGKMHVRYVGEPDPLKRALLEIYVAVATQAKHNDFDTH